MNLEKEWNFIKSEVHNGRRDNLLKREILLYLQILLAERKISPYKDLKRIYISPENH